METAENWWQWTEGTVIVCNCCVKLRNALQMRTELFPWLMSHENLLLKHFSHQGPHGSVSPLMGELPGGSCGTATCRATGHRCLCPCMSENRAPPTLAPQLEWIHSNGTHGPFSLNLQPDFPLWWHTWVRSAAISRRVRNSFWEFLLGAGGSPSGELLGPAPQAQLWLAALPRRQNHVQNHPSCWETLLSKLCWHLYFIAAHSTPDQDLPLSSLFYKQLFRSLVNPPGGLLITCQALGWLVVKAL